ncbi:ral GTPase-activating protein subunit alpha-1 isoform X2 [Cimex lectularius]|uniref:Rap-GAP domain-containing protein n=1 Tax=Cimex lectularius TaxID=79782 RepID=A0A8I6SN11_CIMLE|nr:ral GTPase-activating protein subunit alpha-1 isoform X2 [Cimex lectularius]
MFSKKLHADIKKSTQKLQDPKKDTATRFKHLRIILEHVDVEEAKAIFENNYNHIYYIFYDSFINAETNLRQKELPFHLVHKAHREELEAVLAVLDKLLTLLPELISKRWQSHSLTRLIAKLLHHGNSHKLRREAIRYFLLWYQILGDNSHEEANTLFTSLVPGFHKSHLDHAGSNSTAIFHDNFHGPISVVEIQSVYPPQSGERSPDDLTKFYMDALLEFMVTQVSRIEWKDKAYKQSKCFTFLFDRFKEVYLPQIFPNFSSNTNLFKPYLEIPSMRTHTNVDNGKLPDPIINCKVAVIKWIANFTHLTKTHPVPQIGRSASVTPNESEGERSPGSELRRVSVGQAGNDTAVNAPFTPPFDIHLSEDPNLSAFQTVRDVLYSNRDNVNLIHEIYRQAFLLNFSYAPAIRRAITVYKDWIQMNVIEVPPFMLEPVESKSSGPSSVDFSSIEGPDDYSKLSKLRNDSYLGAISKENFQIRAGLQNVLQVFITDAANVFLLEVNPDSLDLLDDQVEICKRVLNIYRYMVMHTHMEAKTWEQLLIILLHITSLIVSPTPPKKKEETLGGRLAPAIFQTLIVTWIKANLNVVISQILWDQFFSVLSMLTQWEELIKEWAKTLETLTRVLARHVYSLELTDLPLDRLSEQKAKRQRKGVCGTKTGKSDAIPPVDPENMSKALPTARDNTTNIEKEGNLRRTTSEVNVAWARRKISYHLQSPNISGVCELDLEDDRLPALSHLGLESRLNRKWHSVDSLRVRVNVDYDSECATRTPSPAPSSGVESNSFKDSPMQLDVLNNEGDLTENTEDGKSVMSGGTIRGWLPDVAAILWLRMLGALGDINKIQMPVLHYNVFLFLIDLFETLAKIRLNQGIPSDSQITPAPPELVPPLTIFAPWSFQSLNLSEAYHKGKLCALRLLCNMTVLNHDVPLHPKHLSLFYSMLHKGLLSKDQTVINTLIKHCGPRFFSIQLPGFSLLIADFIEAANSVISSSDLRTSPRVEAISILGALLSFPDYLLELPVLEANPDVMRASKCPNLKDEVLKTILSAGKTEGAGVARCIALSNLGIFLHQELLRGAKHPKIKEAINTLLLALRFNHKTVAQTASDVLLLLCDHADVLLNRFPEIPPRIVEVLVGTLNHLMPIGDSDKRLLTSLVFCLGEWTMNIPLNQLVNVHNRTCLLNNVFKVLDDLSEGGKGRGVQVGSFHPDLIQEFNPNISFDDLKQQDIPPTRRTIFASNPASPAHLISTAHSIQLAARLVTSHLVNNLGHFPLTNGGANLGSIVVEQDDVVGLPADQLSLQLFTVPNIQVLVTSLQQLVSLVEVPALDVPGGSVAQGLVSAPSQVRVIIRDLAGKSSWDASALYTASQESSDSDTASFCFDVNCTDVNVNNSIMNSLSVCSLPQHTLRHREPYLLPTYSNSAEDMDNLDDLLQYIGYSSPEILESLDIPRNVPSAPLCADLEQEAMGSILSMRIMQQDYISNSANQIPSDIGISEAPVEKCEEAPFQYCRLLFSQFGMHGWDLRSQLFLVDKNDKLLREMRNLDSQRCRQTHKVAIIYVAHGQEDKNSILSNSGGSHAYEEFIAGLAWEVELETHMGFMGGLQRNKMTGITAPYYATSFTEVMLHVSTRMPSSTPEALLQKTRHLGNDEVHIVWSEHTRDYRRGIIPTEFCDILIVIYPLPHQLYRIQVSRKSDVPYFGPLYNEAIVGHQELPGLVRATALSASRAKRSMLQFYQQYYEERGRSLETVIKNHKKPSTFEEFTANIFSPLQPTAELNSQQKHPGSIHPIMEDGSVSSAGSNGSSTLAALLDSTTHKMAYNSHAGGGGEDTGSWASGEGGDISCNPGISPRPHKKLVIKTGHRRQHNQPMLTPPDSPVSKRSK